MIVTYKPIQQVRRQGQHLEALHQDVFEGGGIEKSTKKVSGNSTLNDEGLNKDSANGHFRFLKNPPQSSQSAASYGSRRHLATPGPLADQSGTPRPPLCDVPIRDVEARILDEKMYQMSSFSSKKGGKTAAEGH